MKAFARCCMAGFVVAALVAAAHAQFATPEDAVAYRKAVMRLVGVHFNAVGAVVKGQNPFDKDAVARDADVVSTLSGLAWEACLVPGSYSGNTTLKENALKEKEAFLTAGGQFEAAAKKLSDTARAGDLDAVKAQFGETAKTCKACHGAYRK